MADRVPPGFRIDRSVPDEPRATIILRTDPWSQCSVAELRQLRDRLRAADIPDLHIRCELRALEKQRGLTEGQFLNDIRREAGMEVLGG